MNILNRTDFAIDFNISPKKLSEINYDFKIHHNYHKFHQEVLRIKNNKNGKRVETYKRYPRFRKISVVNQRVFSRSLTEL